MDSIVKRFSAALTAILFGLWSVLLPVTVHAATYNAASNLTGKQWFVPAQSTGIAGTAVVATAATMLGRANPWIAALTLGTPIMQYLLERKGGGTVAVVPRNAVQPINGDGWTNGIPAATLNPSTFYTTNWTASTSHYASIAEACVAAAAGRNAYLNGSDNVTYSHGNCISTDGRAYGQASPGTSCKSGYTMSQGYCTIIDPWSVPWPSDGVPSITPNNDGTAFIPHPQDPDAMPQAPSMQEIQNPSNNYSPDQFGNPYSTTFTPQSGGGFKVDQRVQTTANNQTTTTINNITINNAGNVVNISTTTVPGSIEQASPTSTPVGASGSGTFPTDYNRESTQQAVQQKLEEIKQGTGAADQPNYATDTDAKKQAMNDAIKEKTDAIPGQYSGDKSNWFSWVWTPPVGNCSPWTSTIHGQVVSWDVCPYVAKVRDVIGFLMAIAGAWLVYNEMFRREDS